jgi:hypothetical protein
MQQARTARGSPQDFSNGDYHAQRNTTGRAAMEQKQANAAESKPADEW